MNLADARIVVRPRGRLETMDLAFRYVLGGLRAGFGLLALATLLPAFTVTVLVRAVWEWSWWGVWGLALALGTLISGVFTLAAGRLLFERKLEPRATLRAFVARLPVYTFALFLSRSLIALGSLFVVPGLIAWMRFAFLNEAILLEQVPARQALSRSASISRAGADDALGMLGATLCLSFLIVLGVELSLTSIVEEVLTVPLSAGSLLEDGGSYYALAGYFMSVPWAAASRFLSYIDGRTRQDGWDVQVRLMSLGEGAP